MISLDILFGAFDFLILAGEMVIVAVVALFILAAWVMK